MMSFVLNFLSPEPLSPLFKANGALYGFNEDLTLMLMAFVALFVIDKLFVSRYMQASARYFALHAFINSIVVVAAAPDVWRVMRFGGNALVGPSQTMVANSSIAAIHIYHCLFFKLGFDDIMHHAVFVTVLCGLAIPFKQVGGSLNNFGCFILSGLPGGIDYVLLVLVKQNYIEKLTEKKWNARIQSWLRSPPMAIYAYCAFQLWLTHPPQDLPFHPIILFIVAALHLVNGVYYSNMAVDTYARHDQQQRDALAKEIEVNKKTE